MVAAKPGFAQVAERPIGGQDSRVNMAMEIADRQSGRRFMIKAASRLRMQKKVFIEKLFHSLTSFLYFLQQMRGICTSGTVFLSVNNHDKANILPIAQELADMGFKLIATTGTAKLLRATGLQVATVLKVSEGRPNGVDHIINGNIDLVINTPLGERSFSDEHLLRQVAVAHGVPVLTTLSGAKAAVRAIAALREGHIDVESLQEHWQKRVVNSCPPSTHESR